MSLPRIELLSLGTLITASHCSGGCVPVKELTVRLYLVPFNDFKTFSLYLFYSAIHNKAFHFVLFHCWELNPEPHTCQASPLSLNCTRVSNTFSDFLFILPSYILFFCFSSLFLLCLVKYMLNLLTPRFLQSPCFWYPIYSFPFFPSLCFIWEFLLWSIFQMPNSLFNFT